MKSLHFFQRFKGSFTDSRFYITVAGERSGKAIRYLILLLILVGLITGAVRGFFFNQEMERVIHFIESDEFPEFQFQNGTFAVDLEEPLTYDVDTQLRVIIDPTNTLTYNKLAGYQTGYLLNEHQLVLFTMGNSPQVYDLSRFDFFTFNKSLMIEYLEDMKPFVLPVSIIGYAIYMVISYFFKSLLLLIMAILIKNMNRIQKVRSSTLYCFILYAMSIGLVVTEALSLLLFSLNFSLMGGALGTILPFITFYMPTIFLYTRGLRVYYVEQLKKDPSTDESSN